MTNTITITGTTQGLQVASNWFETREAADEFAAQFPKSYNFKASSHSTTDDEGKRLVVYVARADAWLTADGVNGGKNETGIARIAKIARKAEKLGAEVLFAQNPKMRNGLTVEQIQDMIA